MSKISKIHSINREITAIRPDEIVTNFMGGDSYAVNPMTTLKMLSASSIFGEPQYYRGSGLASSKRTTNELLEGYSLFADFADDKTTDEVMVEAIDNALSYNFEETLKWAVELRNNFYMRLNPQVIMVRAAVHPGRKKFTEENPGKFNEYNEKVMFRADDPLSQMSYYLYANDGHSRIPSVLKRSWAAKLGSLSPYAMNKYKNAEIGMIDAVRLCHAKSGTIDKLMNGELVVKDTDKTWEMLRSSGMGWAEVFKTVNMGHMALLRNLNGFFSEVTDFQTCKDYCNKLKSGVLKGKQFPFRYFTAYKRIMASDVKHKQMALDTLEECLDISVDVMPKLNGRTAILSDNSGSAWGTLNSEYGTVTVAEINNLSAVISALRSDAGEVYVFGDRLIKCPVLKRNGILKQALEISKMANESVGGGTESGIWLFFKEAIECKEKFDNIFIYSDQQAGHGKLYSMPSLMPKSMANKFGTGHCSGYAVFVNVFKLIIEYRKTVNKYVNVFSIQTAGYTNAVIPEYAYRTNLMYGWTGKEALFASEMIKLWDEVDGHK